jgi:sRNA-binding protein
MMPTYDPEAAQKLPMSHNDNKTPENPPKLSPLQTDRLRGLKEARLSIPHLQDQWPDAFPKTFRAVKPLASDSCKIIAEACGWSTGYTQGVLSAWKSRDAYCQAVLRETVRYDLDGKPTDHAVDANSRRLATRNLQRNAQTRQRRFERQQERERIQAMTEKTETVLPSALPT